MCTQYDVAVYIKLGAEFTAQFTYWTNLMTPKQAISVASTFSTILDSLITGAGKALSELEVFSKADMRQVMRWNSKQPQRIEDCVHNVFADQVARRPAAPAISGWDGEFTYKELDDLSTQLAIHLTSLGVGPEVLVPLCFEKSTWTIVATMAVLKAGGACVPLDPTHPPSRLRDILVDTLEESCWLESQRSCYASSISFLNRHWRFLSSTRPSCVICP